MPNSKTSGHLALPGTRQAMRIKTLFSGTHQILSTLKIRNFSAYWISQKRNLLQYLCRQQTTEKIRVQLLWSTFFVTPLL